MQFIETAVSEAFAGEVGLPPAEMNLARACLLFACADYPHLDCDWYLGQLDLIAHDISAQPPCASDIGARLSALNEYLFEDLGYSGNLDDYYDPRNSYLNEVIDRRLGIPITLSIVYLELAERLGIRAHGISFPGHFLIAVAARNGEFIVDAFDGGTFLERATFVARLREHVVPDTSLEVLEATLRTASKAEILVRQLRNLKAVYFDRGDSMKTLNVLNHLLTIDGDLLPELVDRAALYESIGYSRGAVNDYERALAQLSPGVERSDIVGRLRRVNAQTQHLH